MQTANELISKFGIPVLLIILSIPLILEKVKPNHIYGVRLKTTFSNDETWYKTNKFFGWFLLVFGFAIFLYRFLAH